MTDEQKQEQPTAEEQETLASQQEETKENPEAEIADKEPEKQDSEQINWRKFREQREKERVEREKAEQRARQKEEETEALRQVLETMMTSKESSLTQKEQQDIISDLIDDDIPTGKDIKGFITKQVPDLINSIIEQREAKREEERRKKEVDEMPVKLRTAHRDFDNIVSQENLDYLDYHHPEIAKALSYMPNSFEKWSSVYSAVRKLVPNTGERDLKRMEQNAIKPQHAAAVASPPPNERGYGRSLTEQEKKENYERLRKLARDV